MADEIGLKKEQMPFWLKFKALGEGCLKVLLLLTLCLLLLLLWESVIVLCFVVRYFMSILVLQSS